MEQSKPMKPGRKAEFVKSFSDAGSQVLQVSRRRKVRAEKL